MLSELMLVNDPEWNMVCTIFSVPLVARHQLCVALGEPR